MTTDEMAPSGVDKIVKLQRTRLVDQVTDELRRRILDGTLEPSAQLRQVELSEQLGVSRTPLREAFRVLERDGLVQVMNGNQTVQVTNFSAQDLVDMYEVREFIDGIAARRCARQGLTRDEVASLEDDLATMEKSADPVDLSTYGTAHVSFHLSIANFAQSAPLSEFASIIRITSSNSVPRLARRLWTGEPDSLETLFGRLLCDGNQHHREILDAIEAGDATVAEDTARRHIQITSRAIEALARRSQRQVDSD